MSKVILSVAVILTLGLVVCVQAEVTAPSSSASPEAAPDPAASAQPSPAASPLSGGASRTSPLRIVFVDKEVACACTRKAVDAGWKTLESVVGSKSTVPIKRLFLDKQPAEVAVYRNKRPMVALPAIYVLDKAENIVGMVQGEIKAEELRKLLR